MFLRNYKSWHLFKMFCSISSNLMLKRHKVLKIWIITWSVESLKATLSSLMLRSYKQTYQWSVKASHISLNIRVICEQIKSMIFFNDVRLLTSLLFLIESDIHIISFWQTCIRLLLRSWIQMKMKTWISNCMISSKYIFRSFYATIHHSLLNQKNFMFKTSNNVWNRSVIWTDCNT